jgi:S-adenosylmethionine hydrolase
MMLYQSQISLIATYTDFGHTGPYLGQMAAVLATLAPHIPRVTLMADAPMFDPQSAGRLLSSLCRNLPRQTLVLAVVDPGVGGERRPIMIKNENNLFVGPDNGLFAPIMRRCGNCKIETIDWRPLRLSETFHGRDLFAPVAAKLATGKEVEGTPLTPQEMVGYDASPNDNRVIYIDHYGNAMTGIDSEATSDHTLFSINGATLNYARTFSEVPAGQPFWYRNSIGLVEIAVNRGSAARLFGLELGAQVSLQEPLI